MSKEPVVIKLQIHPGLEEARILDGQSKICNWLYNHLAEQALELKQQFYETKDQSIAKSLYSKRGLRNLLPKIKEDNPFLKVVHSSPLKNTALRISQAIQAHQKSKKGERKGKLTGWPKFRSWKNHWFSLFYDEPNKGFKIENQTLILSLGMGQDRKQRTITIPMPDAHLLKDQTVRNLRIVFELGAYSAVFTVQKQLPNQKPISKVIALDPNHKNLAYGVGTDGKAIEIKAPIWLKNHDKRIDEIKSKRDRCNKRSKKTDILDEQGNPTGGHFFTPSKRFQKYNHTLKSALRKRREQTKTFVYTTAHSLCKNYDCIAIGDYTPKGGGITTSMRRAMNNRSLIGRFKETLCWVSRKSGKLFFEYDEKDTTRTCNYCLYKQEAGIPPAIRQWECPCCQTKHLRDENSAINGLRQVLRNFPKKVEEKSFHKCLARTSIL
jgi:putative transposase